MGRRVNEFNVSGRVRSQSSEVGQIRCLNYEYLMFAQSVC